MSNMSELHADICGLLDSGMSPAQVALVLNVPLDQVQAVSWQLNDTVAADDYDYDDEEV
jgi:hypothetical protein